VLANTVRSRQPQGGDTVSIVISGPPVPEEAFEKYAGKWIAVRGGQEIVAAADDLDTLRENTAIVDTDAFFHVPEVGALFF
jgi:hypothetical protein